MGAVMLAMATPAYAQLKYEVSFLGGYTFAEGITGDAQITPSGTFNAIDVKSGGAFNLSFGVVAGNGAEVGFMWSRQMSELSLSGLDTRTLGDMNIDSYHGYFGYNWRPDSNVRPYFLFGLGATDYGSVAFTKANGDPAAISGPVRFSALIGAGVKTWVNDNFGFKLGAVYTPTYITSDAEGWWCDPYWGCYLVGDHKYSNQFQLQGGVTFRFGGS
jgi:hypothetical protein